MSRRSHPKLALVSTSLHADGSIGLDAPDMPHLHVAIPDAGQRQSVTVWSDTFDAVLGPAEVARWCTGYLGLACGLAYMDPLSHRPIASTYGQPGDVVSFEVTHRCARCVVTTIDQDTSEKSGDGEPLKTLATFRRDAEGVYFGQNLVPRGVGTLVVGDEVEVLRCA